MTSPEFLPPDSAYAQAVEWNWATDPLTNGPGLGVNGWFQRIVGVFKRSWKSLAAIFAVTQLAPTIFFAVLGVLASAWFFVPLQKEFVDATVDGRDPNFDVVGSTANVGFIGLVLLLAVIVLAFVQAAGYGAATYTATRQAAGLPVTLGESLAYGLRRCAGLTGWTFVVGLLGVLGLLACILPVFYVVAATALVGPIYLFERTSPISRSFKIFHNNLGRILGRLALIVVIYYGGAIVVGILRQIADVALGSTDPTVALPTAIGVSVAGAILTLPLIMFLFVGILLTYAEQRANEGPTPAAQLAAEL